MCRLQSPVRQIHQKLDELFHLYWLALRNRAISYSRVPAQVHTVDPLISYRNYPVLSTVPLSV